MTIKFIDLFAGIGGFRYGLERANDTQETGGFGQEEKLSKPRGGDSGSQSDQRQHTFSCVYSSEWDKYAAQIYTKHFGECDTRDIRTVKSEEIPDFDLLVGGFPCQAFSIAGKRKGFDDTRGTLFFEIARILADKRPRYFILENVKGLLSHDEGKTFQTILGVLTDLGYDYQWQVLNSKNFGVPQNRERVFIIGHLRGTPRPKVFPVGENGSRTSEPEQRLSGEIHSENKEGQERQYSPGKSLENGENGQLHQLKGGSQGMRVYDTDGISSTLAGNAGGLGGKTGLYEIEKMKIRRLTPTECERLQGFPDGWTEGVSDTQRYKCLGNAVTTNVISWIGQKLITHE